MPFRNTLQKMSRRRRRQYYALMDIARKVTPWQKPYGHRPVKSMKQAATYPSRRSTRFAQLTKTPVFGKASQYIRNMMYWTGVANLSPVISGVDTDFYFCNGLFDPQAAPGGHQPIGFDQIMLLYEHYAVFRSKITVTFKITGASITPGRVGIYLSPDAIGLSNPGQLMENGLVVSKVIDIFNTDRSTITLTMDCDIKRYFGKSKYKDVMDDEKLTGDVSNNPTEGVYFGVFAADIYGLNALSVDYDAVITYDAVFFEPRKLAQS